MKIVSFTGPKGSGKDTAASVLKEKGYSLGKISFAGPMKEILAKLLGIDVALFEDPQLKEAELVNPIILDLKMIQDIWDEMLKMLPPTEFDYSFVNPFATEQTKLKSFRNALQYIGTEMIRNNVHPDWHVAAAFRQGYLNQLKDGTYCVTDARFPNEYRWLANRFGSDFNGFYVERPEAEEVLKTATHPSELQVKEVRKLIPVENVLKNDGTIWNLETQLLTKILNNN